MIDCPNHTSAPAGGLAIPPCPLDVSRPEIVAALTQGRNLVLSALPGAGKSSRVPLWLMDQPWLEGRRILLLEPRRVAARALAALAGANIEIVLITTSDLDISLLIRQQDEDAALEALHKAFEV